MRFHNLHRYSTSVTESPNRWSTSLPNVCPESLWHFPCLHCAKYSHRISSFPLWVMLLANPNTTFWHVCCPLPLSWLRTPIFISWYFCALKVPPQAFIWTWSTIHWNQCLPNLWSNPRAWSSSFMFLNFDKRQSFPQFQGLASLWRLHLQEVREHYLL